MITVNIRDSEIVKSGGSSKGGQTKWSDGQCWYKVDEVGYEGFAEVVATRLASILNINMPVCGYTLCAIEMPTRVATGCKSASFLYCNCKETTVKRLLQKEYGVNWVNDEFPRLDIETRLFLIVQLLQSINPALVDQLSCLFQFDALVKNGDRHLNNILLRHFDDGHTDIVLFDNGDSCTADLTYDYPKDMSLENCLLVNNAKPFFTTFERQCSLMALYSPFKLKAISNSLYLSDLKNSVPLWFYDRVCGFLKHQFLTTFGKELIIS